MTNLIHSNDLAIQRARVEAYFDDVNILRRESDTLSTVQNKPFLYRPDGSSLDDTAQQFAVWNMRLAPPPITIDTPTGKVQILGMLGDPPCEFPDLGDIVVVDCTIDQVLDPLIEAVPENWKSPLNKRLFEHPRHMLAKAVDNVCRGDIPWHATKADAFMRKLYLWDQYDLAGNPWVQVGRHAMLVKTQRMQVAARQAMQMDMIQTVPLLEGNPVGPNSREIGVFHVDG